MQPVDIAEKMDELAPFISELLGLREFELTVPKGGNLNYGFLLKSPEKQQYFIKHFGTRIQRPKIHYRARKSRYEVEKAVLDTCNRNQLHVPRVIAFSDERLLLVEEYLAGEDLDEYLISGGDEESLLFALGLWLGCFHSIFVTRPCEITLAEIGLKYRKYFYGIIGIDENNLDDQLERLFCSLQGCKVEQLVFCRNDCHLGNFLVLGEELFGIDFEMCSYQPAGLDLASIYLSYLQSKYGNVLPAASTWPSSFFNSAGFLLSGYYEATDCDMAGVFPLYVAVKLLKRSARFRKFRETYLNVALLLLGSNFS